MLNCYYANVSELCPPWDQYPISRQRLEKIGRCVHVSDKARLAGAELLLNYGLKQRFPEFLPPALFETGEHGKPFLKPDQSGIRLPDGKPVHYNLSHSGEYAACVISDSPAGVDIEKERTIRPGIMRFLTDEEKVAVERDPNPYSRFFDFWVLKESYMKAVGTGFAKPPSSFSIRMEDGCYQVYDQGVRQDIGCYLFRLQGGYHLAVCAETKGKKEELSLEEYYGI